MDKTIGDYRSELEQLTCNDKLKINVLTLLAQDHYKYSESITECIEAALLKAKDPQLKLTYLYVMDSIVKNVDRDEGHYIENFTTNLVKTFSHTFAEGNEKIRSSLYRLRVTWDKIFPKGKLYQLDLAVRKVDPKWPIQSAAKASSSASATNGRSAPAAVPSTATVHVNPRFVGNQPSTKEVKTEPKDVSVKTEAKGPLTFADALKSISPEKPKQTKPTPATNSPAITTPAYNPKDPRTRKLAPPAEVKVKEEPMDTLPPLPSKPIPKIAKPVSEESQGYGSQSSSSSTGSRRSHDDERESGRRSPSKRPSRTERKADKPKRNARENQSTEPLDKRRKVKEEPRNSVSWKNPAPMDPRARGRRGMREFWPPNFVDEPSRHSPPIPVTPIIQPTAALGAHAFNIAPPAVSNMPPPQMYGMPPTTAMQMMPPPAGPFHTGPPPTTVQFAPNPYAQATAAFAPMAGTGGIPPPQIRSDTPRLPNLPSNNKIFVDGKAYEVLFLDGVAVIERNGVPHRISFSGPPRDLIIDGIGYPMAFGEVKDVVIDGLTHRVRFGAPSRELYMGDFAFRGAFGGAPITATINGRKHEFKLCGPPPEVKIEQDPCHELTRQLAAYRHSQLPAASTASGAPPVQEEKKDMSISELLDRLNKTGVLDRIRADVKGTATTPAVGGQSPTMTAPMPTYQPPPPPPSTITVRPPSPGEAPIPAQMAFQPNAEKDMPTTSLSDFSVHSIRMRYKSVVQNLHAVRSLCSECGVYIEDMNSAAYRRHLDDHARRDSEAASNSDEKYSRRRQPFPSEQDWLKYSLTDSVNRMSLDVPAAAEAEKVAEPVVEDTLSNATKSRKCDACHEDFVEYYDNDVDEWRLRDCTMFAGKTYHRHCKSDFSMDDSALSTELGDAAATDIDIRDSTTALVSQLPIKAE